MIYKSSYILKFKKQEAKETKEKSKESTTIVLSTLTTKNILLHHLKLTNEQCTIEGSSPIFTILINDTQSCWYGMKFLVHESPRVLFLDVTVEGTEISNIEKLEKFYSTLNESQTIPTYSGREICICKYYDIIKTYDDVSSYYCKLLYPKLDEFDRKIRLLMYNTYYIALGATFPDKFNYYFSNGKLNKRGKKTDITASATDAIFYECDYTQLINILFFDIRQISDGNEKTDWELFFADKIQLSHPKEDMEELKGLRNKIAHCKLFSKDDYEKTLSLLSKYCIAIDRAIQLTYSKDFINEFFESLKGALLAFSEQLNELSNQVLKNFFGKK